MLPASSVMQNAAGKYESLLHEMATQSYDSIRFPPYRTASKLRFIQKRTNFHLVDIWNTIEAIRENGLHIYQDINAEMPCFKMEMLITSIFYQLNKRLPPSQHLNIDESISYLFSFLLNTYDPTNTGNVRVFAIKIALSTLCSGNIIDKLKYAHSLISDTLTGHLIGYKFGIFIRELFTLCSGVFETASFPFSESLPKGLIDFTTNKGVTIDFFMELFLAIPGPAPALSWYVVLNKMEQVENVVHQTICNVCHRASFTGFRYKCRKCFNYNLCQDCFWRGRTSGQHNVDSHQCKEYAYWKSSGKRIGHTLRKSFRCFPSNKKANYTDDELASNNVSSSTSSSAGPRRRRLNLAHIIPPSPIPGIHAQKNGFGYSSDGEFINDTNTMQSKSSAYTISMNNYNFNPVDDEHRLIAHYAAKLAAEGEEEKMSSAFEEAKAYNSKQQQLISQLESRNREMMREIARLRHEQELNNMISVGGADDFMPLSHGAHFIDELSALRARRADLTNHLSSLKENRRELSSQLENLMAILGSSGVDRPILAGDRSAESTLNRHSNRSTISSSASIYSDIEREPPISGNHSGSSTLNRNLRSTADTVSTAMSFMVKELDSSEKLRKMRKNTADSDERLIVHNLEKQLKLKDESSSKSTDAVDSGVDFLNDPDHHLNL